MEKIDLNNNDNEKLDPLQLYIYTWEYFLIRLCSMPCFAWQPFLDAYILEEMDGNQFRPSTNSIWSVLH